MSNPTTASSDLSTRVGGRVITPALPVVDASFPNDNDSRFSQCLKAYSDEHIQIEAIDEIRRRERVLNAMSNLCREWVEGVCRDKLGLSEDIVQAASGKGRSLMFTSGSFRLGVHEPGADIDSICVAPRMVTKEHFFGSSIDPVTGNVIRDPSSLAERIRRHPDVTNFNAVETAAVPILTFDWEGVNIDLLFARLATTSVPLNLDIDNDKVLDGVDSATEKSLNGPRVTNLIAALVSGTPERYQHFLFVVRCVRKWAKARGLYSNKMGYWGGVNINISVALVIQLYPNASPGNLLRKFFLVFKSWRWPNPVMLCKPHDAGLGLQVWSAFTNIRDARQVAPIVTPAYPAMNSTLSVSRQTLQILTEEFCRGHDILSRIWQDTLRSGDKSFNSNGELFAELFKPADFFISYPRYLSVCIVGPTPFDLQSWAGYVESRLRRLVSEMLGKGLPLNKIQLWPKKVEGCVAERDSNLTLAQRKNCLTYFIGFNVDAFRMRGNDLNIEQQIHYFKEGDLRRYPSLVNGQDIVFGCHKVKELPRIVFSEYDGSKEEAMKLRRQKLDTDPKRIEAKRLRELKEKEDEVERKKASLQEKIAKLQAAAKGSTPVHTDRIDPKDESASIKTEDTALVDEAIDQEETDLLENALDTIQDKNLGVKTREEAAQDRLKLMAGLSEDITSIDKNEVGIKSKSDDVHDLLREAGFHVISDDEIHMLGANFVPRWRRHDLIEAECMKRGLKRRYNVEKVTIQLKTKFEGIVELDANGFIIDKGDVNFFPSKQWIGRRAGFEFKLAERGLGYYRTGCKVVVPSNTAY